MERQQGRRAAVAVACLICGHIARTWASVWMTYMVSVTVTTSGTGTVHCGSSALLPWGLVWFVLALPLPAAIISQVIRLCSISTTLRRNGNFSHMREQQALLCGQMQLLSPVGRLLHLPRSPSLPPPPQRKSQWLLNCFLQRAPKKCCNNNNKIVQGFSIECGVREEGKEGREESGVSRASREIAE